jgi:hypothetical protein
MVSLIFLATTNHIMTHPSDAITSNSPFPIFTTVSAIATDPTFTTIFPAHMELNVNAASFFSTQYDGIHGHLALTIGVVEYITRSVGGAEISRLQRRQPWL